MSEIKRNGNFDYLDPEGISHEHPYDYLAGIIGLCGCGSHDELAKKTWVIFKAIVTEQENKYELIYENELNEFIAHMLNHKELLEHGTSVGGSWVTEKGQKVYDWITNQQSKMSDIKMPFGFPEKKFQHLEDIEFCKRLPLDAIVSICIDYQSLQAEIKEFIPSVHACIIRLQEERDFMDDSKEYQSGIQYAIDQINEVILNQSK